VGLRRLSHRRRNVKYGLESQEDTGKLGCVVGEGGSAAKVKGACELAVKNILEGEKKAKVIGQVM